MPERVDFYVLQSDDESARHTLACRLAEKGFQQGLRVYVRAQTDALAELIDRQLWAFSSPGFVPHRRDGGKQALIDLNSAEVLIGVGSAPAQYNQMLISLTHDVPEDADHFQRIADLIINRDDDRQRGRERFRAWRQRGLEPTTHNL